MTLNLKKSPTDHFDDLIPLLNDFGLPGLQVIENSEHMHPINAVRYLIRATIHFRHYKDRTDEFDRMPVDVQTFIEHEAYLDKRGVTWPKVMKAMRELNQPQKYVEAVLTGGIGTAKTHVAIYTQAYQLYLLSCMTTPHAAFGLDPSSEIVIIFQSITEALAKAVDFHRFKDMVLQSVYFNQSFPFDPNIVSELRFPKRIIVKPVAGGDTAALGHNVIGGLIDELNFMAVVEDSKQSIDGSVYDQAVQNYNAIARRRESRFMQQGQLAGMLCLVSSKRYPGQFTDRKVDQAARDMVEHGRTSIYVYDKRVWDVRPKETFSGETFKVYIGERHLNPYVIADDDAHKYSADSPLIDEVPVEFKHSYDDDIHAALRDISGISSQLQHAYFTDMVRLDAAFGTHKNLFSVGKSDFIFPKLTIRPKLFIDPDKLHYAHVDLGATADSAGVCIGHIDHFVQIKRTDGVIEDLPLIIIDGIVEIPPPRGGEIDFAKIRAIFYRLRELGMNLKWISYDSWQSRDSLQLLKNRKFIVGTVSLDKDAKAYDLTKRAINDGRVRAPDHPKLEEELRTLQWFRDKDKIDHLPNGSKDCADAFAGVVYGLSMRREIWVKAGVRPTAITQKEKEDDKEYEDEEV